MSTDAKRAANARYIAKMKVWTLRVKPETAEQIQAAAAANGESVQGYILEACARRMAQDAKPENQRPAG